MDVEELRFGAAMKTLHLGLGVRTGGDDSVRGSEDLFDGVCEALAFGQNDRAVELGATVGLEEDLGQVDVMVGEMLEEHSLLPADTKYVIQVRPTQWLPVGVFAGK